MNRRPLSFGSCLLALLALVAVFFPTTANSADDVDVIVVASPELDAALQPWIDMRSQEGL